MVVRVGTRVIPAGAAGAGSAGAGNYSGVCCQYDQQGVVATTVDTLVYAYLCHFGWTFHRRS